MAEQRRESWRRPPKHDYMKYWRVIRYFFKIKYDLSTSDLDMLLFLHSEKYFNRQKFNEFSEIFPWDKNRFQSLRKRGWITIFRKRKGKQTTLYEISYKGKIMISTMYKKLDGDPLPETHVANPLFLKNVPYMHKVYRNEIIKMNKFIREQRPRLTRG